MPPRRVVRRALTGLLLAAVATAGAGCSLSIPVSGPDVDDAATGSIDRASQLFPAELDREDLRRAKAALAVALDPQGNGARVAWANPQTGARGGFEASALPFPEHDRVCRAFKGVVTPEGGSERRLSGSACRDGDGSWQMRSGEATKA